MNLQLLIDAIVHQTTVLVAQLATSGGSRAPLAHIANQVFLELADELSEQGVSRKVSAGMFGLSLRAYQRKIQRLRADDTHQGRPLWESVLGLIQQRQVITRAELLGHFNDHDADLLGGMLHDLCDSGLVFRSGRGASTAYRVVDEDELRALAEHDDGAALEQLLWALIYRGGPLTHSALVELSRGRNIDDALTRLIADGRVQRVAANDPVYTATAFGVPEGAAAGWEAAVFDHYQALVRTIVSKLANASDGELSQVQGGSTYSVTVWDDHPLKDEALAQLAEFRRRTGELRARIKSYNAQHSQPAERIEVTIYGGQHVIELEDDSSK